MILMFIPSVARAHLAKHFIKENKTRIFKKIIEK